jgi:AcrR family transcriptional regulator
MVQKRSFETRGKIIATSMELIAEIGYFALTTNEVARRAKVSIGSLYSYFSDKKDIMLACMEQYHELVKASIDTDDLEQAEQQGNVRDTASSAERDTASTTERDAASTTERDEVLALSIRNAIKSVFAAHRIMPGFHRAMMAACLQDADIRELEARHNDDSRQRILSLLLQWQQILVPTNIPLAADMIYLLISETVHGYMNGTIEGDEEQLVDELTRMVRAYVLPR